MSTAAWEGLDSEHGAGSEMIGAMQAGWPSVVGIERDAEYVAIAKARIKHAKAKA